MLLSSESTFVCGGCLRRRKILFFQYFVHILLHADVPIAADHSLFPKRLRKTIARHRTAVVTSSQRGDFSCLGDGFVLAHQWSMNGAPYYGQRHQRRISRHLFPSAVAKGNDKGARNSPFAPPSSIFAHITWVRSDRHGSNKAHTFPGLAQRSKGALFEIHWVTGEKKNLSVRPSRPRRSISNTAKYTSPRNKEQIRKGRRGTFVGEQTKSHPAPTPFSSHFIVFKGRATSGCDQRGPPSWIQLHR
ncbi:hypothetical protein CEXT_302881 [Caerostris extrusa]|uniref:Uncharacterized protein n=1 Tax=Caerostris extrusa TaxID=172846 RepID=A0AAV4V431_CAEEX|nr:hypothetical protein CEXT_302881 [Caerostris extrusa]